MRIRGAFSASQSTGAGAVERLRVYYQNRRNKTGHLKRLVVAQQTADAYDSPVLAGGATWASSINVITSTADPGVAAAALARDQFMQTVKTELSNPAADLEAARAEGHVNPQVATHPAAVEEVAVIPPRAAEVAQPLEVVSAAHAAAIAQPLGVVSAVIQQATTAAAAAVLPTAATRSEPLPLPPKPTPPPPPLMPHGRQNTQVATTKAISKKAGQAAKKREATEAMAAVDHAVDSSDEDSARQPPVGEASNPVPIIAKKKPKPNVPPPFTETTECKEHDLVVLPYDMTLFERGQPIAVFYPPKGNAELSTDDWYLGHVTKPLANKLQVRPIASRVSLSRSSHVMYACMHVCMYACMHVSMYACMHVVTSTPPPPSPDVVLVRWPNSRGEGELPSLQVQQHVPTLGIEPLACLHAWPLSSAMPLLSVHARMHAHQACHTRQVLSSLGGCSSTRSQTMSRVRRTAKKARKARKARKAIRRKATVLRRVKMKTRTKTKTKTKTNTKLTALNAATTAAVTQLVKLHLCIISRSLISSL